ncbi:hypothetical protein P280DRAFT_464710 [Massarina eburnea CBS 473.64]|uniref:Zn(2)-C6 fungal-type domain-containing protein n=1 Tax=Massarina eburnea CBS 473.64 TaxID=1395130 RepID=A0A6A6SJB9_9PLEO|nr:hypothetical protein P280DRAFT_464710 [Massarina eburnea CBS 473.64]
MSSKKRSESEESTSAKDGKERKKAVRKKVWKPKTKTGCMTCRIRRVKCDEAKPSCNRCSSTGRSCDGYDNPASTLQSHAIVCSAPQLPITIMPGLDLSSTEEQEAFHFFKHHTANELSGFFDSSFWQFEILQASHTLPSIRHAIIAMAAMHRKLIMGRMPVVPDDCHDKQLVFAVHQSTLALEALGKSTQTLSDSKDLLTTSILFYCLSCFQGHQTAAIEHLRSGLRILRQVYADFDITKEYLDYHPISLNTLRAMFVTMDLQARGILSDAVIGSWEPQPPRDFFLPSNFKTFTQARHCFETLLAEILTLKQGMDYKRLVGSNHRVLSQVQHFQDEFNVLGIALDSFLAQLSPMTGQDDRKSILSITLLREQVRVYLRGFAGLNEHNLRCSVGWHVDENDTGLLLDLATELLGAPKELTMPDGALPEDYYPHVTDVEQLGQIGISSCARPVFSSSSGVVSALWLVTSRARSSGLRRRAIALLLRYPRREGVWDSVVAGRLAWERMILEETALEGRLGVRRKRLDQRTGYIPDCNKVRSVAVDYVGPRLGKVQGWSMNGLPPPPVALSVLAEKTADFSTL